MSTPKKAAKPKTKAVNAEVKLTPATKVAFVCVRPNGKTGPKTKIMLMVPKKGTIAFKALSEKAEAEGMKAPTIARFVKRLARDGHVELSN